MQEVRVPVERVSLYQKEEKIYPRDVEGRFARLRRIAMVALLGIFYLGPFLMWEGRQALLFDLPEVLHLRPDAVAAGLHLPCTAADTRRALVVLLHGAGRAALVRLRLSANGLDRGLRADRALVRRRPH